MLTSLPRVFVGRDNYTEEQRQADFRILFSTDVGARVIAQIMQICDPFFGDRDFENPGRLAAKAGMRRVGLEIQRCFMVRGEPRIERVNPRDGTVEEIEL